MALDRSADSKQTEYDLFHSGDPEVNSYVVTRDPGTSWSNTYDSNPSNPDKLARNGFVDDWRGYQYGRSATGADDAVKRTYAIDQNAAAVANAAMAAGNETAATGQDMYSRGIRQQQQFTGNANAYNQRQTAQPFANQIAGLETTEGPSAAQSQLQNGTNMAMAQQLAMARSGRGLGGNAAAMSQAQGNLAGISANQANQAAGLRAQENAAWRQRQASNLGLANNQILQGQGQNDAQVNAMFGLGQQAQGQGNQGYLAARQQQGQGFGLGLESTKSALGAQALANEIRAQEMKGGMTSNDDTLRQWAAMNNYTLAGQARQDQQNAGLISAGASFLGNIFS